MPLREDILNPIAGDNPCGQNLRYAPIYDKIKEARREDDELAQGAWQLERKAADWGQVSKLCQEAIATQSKDLQLAVWLAEALLRQGGIRGFSEGLGLCRDLLEKFWDTLYPELDEGDAEQRAAPLEWLASEAQVGGGSRPIPAIKKVALCREGYGFVQYKDSRTVGYDDQAASKDAKTAREKALKEGKLAPEIFDKSFVETPKAFYADLEKQFDGALGSLKTLNETCQAKFADATPGFGRLTEALTDVRQVVHSLLQKKRETEPDPVEEAPPAEGAEAAAEGGEGAGGAPAEAGVEIGLGGRVSTEPAEKREAVESAVKAAAVLRKRDPLSPASYLMLRGLRWGELRGSSDPVILEAPPSDLRYQVKALASRNRWAEVLELAEQIMALPCSRAWLDLQRFVVEACTALGDTYNPIAIAIRSELRTLLRDLPNLLDAKLTDDTPAANSETQTWLRELLAEPSDSPPLPSAPHGPAAGNAQAPGWQKRFVDPQALAQEAMRASQPAKAVEILQRELERQTSGRGRFLRKLQLAQICITAGKDPIAQLLMDECAAAIEAHKLDEWEDREMIARALVFLVQNSKKIQGDAKVKQAMFERICRLDPVQALTV
ncbi:MAG TPA: type VI secretion system protein TssA [Bryobacteraceae bacterium]|nr:type VI secretion system protein TssA [Bryobacteraceae bacterium]